MTELTARPVPEETMHDLRDQISAEHPDVIAVVVLSGTKETGLAMGVSSAVTEEEMFTGTIERESRTPPDPPGVVVDHRPDVRHLLERRCVEDTVVARRKE